MQRALVRGLKQHIRAVRQGRELDRQQHRHNDQRKARKGHDRENRYARAQICHRLVGGDDFRDGGCDQDKTQQQRDLIAPERERGRDHGKQ